jgi:dolichol-phosphate mannosyltransferase
MIDLTVIVCVFNEISRIDKGLSGILNAVQNNIETFEIIVIDNNSNDGTREYVKNLSNKNIKVVLNKKNIGKGGSIRKGIDISNGNIVAIYDPDLEYDPLDVIKCYQRILKSNAQCVLASRRLHGDKNYHYAINYLGVAFLTLITNILYKQKLTDVATAIKMFNGNFIRNIKLSRNGFNLDFELVCRTIICNGLIEEIQAKYYPRTKDEGKKIKVIKDGFQSISCIVNDRFVTRKKLIKK